MQRSGDNEAEFDGFHNTNRNAAKGFGTFHSSEFGFCLKIITTGKQTAGVDGVAQRHEKVALKIGLEELIVRDGYVPDLIGTDACKGAPKDIALVSRYYLHSAHYSLLTTHYSLLPTHYSLPTTHYSLLTTHYSLLPTHYSLLTTHYSLLTTHYSLLTAYYLLLTTHYSLLTTHCSLPWQVTRKPHVQQRMVELRQERDGRRHQLLLASAT